MAEARAASDPDAAASALVDVVVVSYNSRADLRDCVEPLVAPSDLSVVVVDNASIDGSLDAIRDLELKTVHLERNCGFAYGCNRGWLSGSAPYVLFLNPDARIDPRSIRELVETVGAAASVGAAAPRVLDNEGALHYSLRRFPRLRSTYAQALFLHRVFHRATWTDELVRNPHEYERAGAVEWASGACLLVRRDVLEQVSGWDEDFFLYCEDKDLCRRIRDAGYDIRYSPQSTVVHAGGASAPRASLLPTLAASRVRYASKHAPTGYALLERIGIALGSLTHLIAGKGGRETRLGHARAFGVATGISRRSRP